jgi:hypothetical protein
MILYFSNRSFADNLTIRGDAALRLHFVAVLALWHAWLRRPHISVILLRFRGESVPSQNSLLLNY